MTLRDNAKQSRRWRRKAARAEKLLRREARAVQTLWRECVALRGEVEQWRARG